MDSINGMITDLGFPIVVCVAVGLFAKKIIENNREDNIKREERFYDEMKYNREVNCTLLETNKTLANDINVKIDRLINESNK